jgi:myo-inositol 2-dehydrogenase/D-chiro-inositol 1-dehydrogenase
MSSRVGVGFLGAGLATQAIHLPTLATLLDRFRLVRVMDVDSQVAQEVAAWAGADPATTAAEVLDDPAVEVVAICSPPQFHAGQLVDACRAGKRAVLCEKPLATSVDEADSIAAAVAKAGMPVVVGAMHAYDPAVRAAFACWAELGETASLVHSAIYLPANDVFIRQATEPLLAAQHRPAAARQATSEAYRLREGNLGLASHTIPLVRSVAPAITTLHVARTIAPWGYAFAWSSGEAAVEMFALMPGAWGPDWRLRIVGERHEMRVRFPPSYVLAGSARAEIIGSDRSRAWEFSHNGYQSLWSALAAQVDGASPLVPFAVAVDDLRFALDLAARTDELLGRG